MAKAQEVRPKPVTINLDKERGLLFDFNAFIELEDIYGSIEDAMNSLGKGKRRLRPIRDLVWAGLLHEDENLTVRQVGRLLTIANIEEVAGKGVKAIEASIPDTTGEGQPGK